MVIYTYELCSASEPGEYGLEIDVSDASTGDTSFYQVCQYLIVCAELSGGGTMGTPPRVPQGFLGPQPDCQRWGVECTSHDDPYIVATSGELEVSQCNSRRSRFSILLNAVLK